MREAEPKAEGNGDRKRRGTGREWGPEAVRNRKEMGTGSGAEPAWNKKNRWVNVA